MHSVLCWSVCDFHMHQQDQCSLRQLRIWQYVFEHCQCVRMHPVLQLHSWSVSGCSVHAQCKYVLHPVPCRILVSEHHDQNRLPCQQLLFSWRHCCVALLCMLGWNLPKLSVQFLS